MSKRLQITLTDDAYKKLNDCVVALHGCPKSAAIACGIEELHKLLQKNGLIDEKK